MRQYADSSIPEVHSRQLRRLCQGCHQRRARFQYHGVLLADGWRGRADFLVRVDLPSALGPWSYEAWDTKLARHAKPSHVLQLSYYGEQVAAIQRVEPEWMHVILGTGEQAHLRSRDFTSYFRAVRGRFLRAVNALECASPYGSRTYALMDLASTGYTPSCTFDFPFNRQTFRTSSGKSWKTTREGMQRKNEERLPHQYLLQ